MDSAHRPSVTVRCPGRVNLIGEHTDYQEGLVLPFAVDLSLEFVAVLREGGPSRFESELVPGVVEFRPGEEPGGIEPAWARYPAAVLTLLRRAGLRIPDIEARIGGNLPVGAGLSSSAALCVGTVLLALKAAGQAGESVPPECSDPVFLARLCRDAEGLATGVRCGLMDPLSILTATEGAATLIDCRDLSRRQILLESSLLTLVIADTRVRRSLGAGAYNRRREECEEAVELLRSGGVPATTLRDLEPADLPRARKILPELLFRRARHVVTENARVQKAADALSRGDVEHLGVLLDASHESLSADFQVSCPELDLLAARARSVPGVLGCRMIGGGFGGMVLAAVHPSAQGDLLAALPTSAGPRVVSPVAGSR